MTYQFRLYRNHESDALPVIEFLSRISMHPQFVADYYVGDFVWQGYRAVGIGFDERLGIWQEQSGSIVGLCWLTPPNETSFTIDPALYGTPDERQIIFEMMDWTLLRLPDLRGDKTDPIGATVPIHDQHQPGIMTELGLVFSGETWYNANFRTIDEPINVPALPDGYRIVEMDDSADLADRVEIHREVWSPSKFTMETYKLLRAAPVYRMDLDLAVMAPDGRYACYLIAWHDPAALTLVFEPVGARTEFRRLGLSRALIMETLRRGQSLGANRAYVNSEYSAEPANALYQACGFETISGYQWWHYPEPAPKP